MISKKILSQASKSLEKMLHSRYRNKFICNFFIHENQNVLTWSVFLEKYNVLYRGTIEGAEKYHQLLEVYTYIVDKLDKDLYF